MDRRVKVPTNHAASFKTKDGGIGRRELRAHRRSIVQKSARDLEVNKRRNIDDLSPLKEVDQNQEQVINKPQNKLKSLGEPPKKGDKQIRDRLQKYKEEKELKKKLQARERAKSKPGFKVMHVQHKDTHLFKMDKKMGEVKAKEALPPPAAPATRRSTRGAMASKPAAPEPRRVTRQAAKSSNIKVSGRGLPARNKNTSSSESSADDKKTRKPTKRTSTAVSSKAPVSSKMDTAKPKSAAAIPSKASQRDTHMTSQMSDFSFAPGDFTFQAPSNLPAFQFKPLSPNSAASFLMPQQEESYLANSPVTRRRCSTPKVAPPVTASSAVAPGFCSVTEKSSESDITTGPSDYSDSDSQNAAKKNTPYRRKSTRKSKTPAAKAKESQSSSGESDKEVTLTGSRRRSCRTVRTPAEKNSHMSESFTSSPQKRLRRSMVKTPVHSATPKREEAEPEMEEKIQTPVSEPAKEIVNISAPFKTPTSTVRSVPRRRRPLSSKDGEEKTPKSILKSPMARARTPEERIQILYKSPMVEMRRRTPKEKTPENALDPLPCFDDLDDLPPPPLDLNDAESGEITAPADTVETMETGETTEPYCETSEPAVPTETTEHGKPTETTELATPVETMPAETAASKAEELADATPSETAEVKPTETTEKTEPMPTESDDSKPAQIEESKPATSEPASTQEKGSIEYFKGLIESSNTRLIGHCEEWEALQESLSHLSEDVLNDIRNAVGKARLLMGAKGRLMQFTTLVSDCENKTGEQTLLLSDLQGFWDMVSFQVDDCYFMFATLEKLRGNNWIKEEPVKVQPKKKIIKKKPAAVSKPKAPAKSRFAEFRNKMLKKTAEKKEEVAVEIKITEEKDVLPASPRPVPKAEEGALKTFEAGFFKIDSPVRSPRPHCEGASPAGKGSPVRDVRRRSKSSQTPGSKVSPFLMKVLERSARKSLGIPMNFSRPSPLLKDSTAAAASPSCSARRCSRRSAALSFSNTPKLPGVDAPSIFTPDQISEEVPMDTDENMTPRRGTRRSSVRSALQPSNVDNQAPVPGLPAEDNFFLKYLQPAVPTESEEMESEENPSQADVEMSAQMKRDLSKEFSDSSGDQNGSTTGTPKSTRRSAKKTPSNRQRHISVHFDNVSPEHEMAAKLPVTPYNRNSLVAGPRSSGRKSLSSKLSEVVTPSTGAITKTPNSATPATRFAKLRMDFTPGSKGLGNDLLFTPPTGTASPGLDKSQPIPTATLISFTPEAEASRAALNPAIALARDILTPSSLVSPRRSSRLSTFNGSLI